jgi:hypothetical protein
MPKATVAQLVEHLTRNEKVASSILAGGSRSNCSVIERRHPMKGTMFLFQQADGTIDESDPYSLICWKNPVDEVLPGAGLPQVGQTIEFGIRPEELLLYRVIKVEEHDSVIGLVDLVVYRRLPDA